MIYLWVVVLLLVGAVITLYILLSNRPKDDNKKIKELKKEIISDGKRFEQLEFRLENLKEKISKKKSGIDLKDKGMVKVRDCLDEMEKEIEDISGYFSETKKDD